MSISTNSSTPFDGIYNPIIAEITGYLSTEDASNFFSASKNLNERRQASWHSFIQKELQEDCPPLSRFALKHFTSQGLQGFAALKAAGQALVVSSRILTETRKGNLLQWSFINDIARKIYERDPTLFHRLSSTLQDLKQLSSFSDQTNWMALVAYTIVMQNNDLLSGIDFRKIYLSRGNIKFLSILATTFQNKLFFEKLDQVHPLTGQQMLDALYSAIQSPLIITNRDLVQFLCQKLREGSHQENDCSTLRDLFQNGISLDTQYPFDTNFLMNLVFFQLIPVNGKEKDLLLRDAGKCDIDILLLYASLANQPDWVQFLLDKFGDKIEDVFLENFGLYGSQTDCGLHPALFRAAHFGCVDALRVLAHFPRTTKHHLQSVLNKIRFKGPFLPDQPNRRAEREEYIRARMENPHLKEIEHILETAIDLRKEPLLAAPPGDNANVQ